MSEQLSGRELDKAIALALGIAVVDSPDLEWDDSQRDWVSLYYVGVDGTPREVRYYSADANAVIDVCSARGWRLSFGRNGEKQPYATIEWDYNDWNFVIENAATPQEAAARALLAAITAEAGT